MVYYIIVVAAIVLLSSIVLISILNKNNLLNIRTIVAISLSSITISLIVPFIFGFLIGTEVFSGLGIFIAFFIGFMAYILLIFLFTILVLSIISETKAQEIWNVMVNGLFMKFINNFVKMIKGFLLNAKNKLVKLVSTLSKRGNKNLEYLNLEEGQFTEESVSSEINADSVTSEININDTSDIMESNSIPDFEFNNLNENSELDNIESTEQEEIIPNDEFEVNIDYFKGVDVNTFDIEKAEENDVTNSLEILNYNESKLDEEEEINLEEEKDQEQIEEKIEDQVQELKETGDSLQDEDRISNLVIDESQGIDLQTKEDQTINVLEKESEEIENNMEYTGYMEEVAVEREIIISNTENDLDNLKDVETGGLKIDKVIGNIEEQTVSKANEDLSIAQYIDEAFRLKGLGDFEGAILYYMYALDKNPDKDAVFWIVLDTCVLYKELGQIELAKEILESYVSSYGDLMDVAVRAEIESNLINI